MICVLMSIYFIYL